MFSWSRSTRLVAVVGGVAILLAVVALLVVSLDAGSGNENFYLALGDSLSVGIQPTVDGAQVKTADGYTNVVLARAALEIPHLRLVEMGCPGETSASLVSGQGDDAAARVYACDRAGGSQLEAAIAFIRSHRAHVRLVSIDIGTNDLISCAGAGVAEKSIAALAACVHTAAHEVAVNLPKILAPLRSATAPGTALVSGTVYDPFLVGGFSSIPRVRAIAAASVTLVRQFNQVIVAADKAAGFGTADVAGAFASAARSDVHASLLGHHRLPRDLVVLCSFTYLCVGQPQGPDIHPDRSGYRAMGAAYVGEMPDAAAAQDTATGH